MSIRQARPSDTDAVAALFDQYRTFYGKPSDVNLARSFISQRMHNSESVLFVADTPDASAGHDNGIPLVGFVQLYPCFSSVSAARIYVLNDLYVAVPYRRLGLARALLLAAQAFASDAGAVRMALSTGVENQSAQALYESLGWTQDNAFVHYSLALALGSAAAPAGHQLTTPMS